MVLGALGSESYRERFTRSKGGGEDGGDLGNFEGERVRHGGWETKVGVWRVTMTAHVPRHLTAVFVSSHIVINVDVLRYLEVRMESICTSETCILPGQC